MADEPDALLARADDEALRRDLAAQITKLRQKRQFGLVSEEHLPERVALPQHGIRRGTKVVRRDSLEDGQRVVLRVRRTILPMRGVSTLRSHRRSDCSGRSRCDFGEGSLAPWRTLRRSDLSSKRGTKKGGTQQFLPIYIANESGRILEVGEPLDHDAPRDSAPHMPNATAVFPVREDGTEMNGAALVHHLDEPDDPAAPREWRD